ncbi:hypothetical protein V501_04877 [Pseudogymnoascus sp. VKM F-4519 (FW-2642)]|nr:hypothetical protein V501_04877 [Pseudogymnoascus sp. VKM F-4519 (FW-2642)]
MPVNHIKSRLRGVVGNGVNKKTRSELSEAEKKAQEEFKSEREESKGGLAANVPTPIEATANESIDNEDNMSISEVAAAQTPRLRQPCQEKIRKHQDSFNEMMECLQGCHEDEPPEKDGVLSQGGEGSNSGAAEPEPKLRDILEGRSSILGLPRRIAKERLGALCYDIDGPGETQFPIINLAELQRLNIYALRKRLAVKAIDIFQSESLCDSEAWRIKDLMSDYCNALRDFDYMLQKDDIEMERDPFYLMYSRWCDWAIMRPVVDKLYKSDKEMMEIPRDHEDAEMIGDARAWTKKRARDASFYKRF